MSEFFFPYLALLLLSLVLDYCCKEVIRELLTLPCKVRIRLTLKKSFHIPRSARSVLLLTTARLAQLDKRWSAEREATNSGSLRWLNTVLWAVSCNLGDGACFKLEKQTWR